ncbi:MAG: preprotein translocase subunit SecA [Chloroflexi bacterium]|nr:preprotein translocase subunit SecA [Chloroflexota bacterium]
MGPVYELLGLTVGVIQHEAAFVFDSSFISPDPRLWRLRPVERRNAYMADITYGTNNEFGFDYLRDNMVLDRSQCAQRELNYAIVDEVDNILIDEARTPLIISGQAEDSTKYYNLFARLVPRLQREMDYKIDEKLRVVTLTDVGIGKVEQMLGVHNLYDPANYELTHYLEQALKAEFIFKRERDYVLVKNGQVISHASDAEVVIVDEFTGRLMFGRRYSEGLHQAIEAKENVKIQRESQTLATITFQNFFRMYQKLAGMTGTAATEQEEFHKIYNLDVVTIPTHRPMIRQDLPDLVYKTEDAKFQAVVKEIADSYEVGRPVLVGTVSIEKSEHLSERLRRKGIPHQVLNAKYHEKEAAIIAQAGRPKAVTIATNMAGRGVDILLGGNPSGLIDEILQSRRIDPRTATPEQAEAARQEATEVCARDHDKVISLGGLHIVGTERHEARRIDNQLRGRAGRQGDPGASRFYVSLQDDLMRRFGGTSVASIMDRLGIDDDVPIEHSLVTKSIENSQTKVEGYNFDIRKHVVQYDDVMNKQREVIYAERRKILTKDDLKSIILEMTQAEVAGLVSSFTGSEHDEEWDIESLLVSFKAMVPNRLQPEDLHGLSVQEIEDRLVGIAEDAYEQKERDLGGDLSRRLERIVMLRVIDRLWIDHLTALDELREGIGLRAYGQRDPLVEFKTEAYNAFQGLLANIQRGITHEFYYTTVRIEQPVAPREIRTNRDDSEQRPREPVRAGGKVGRNDPCPCGSGKKYKKCHGK